MTEDKAPNVQLKLIIPLKNSSTRHLSTPKNFLPATHTNKSIVCTTTLSLYKPRHIKAEQIWYYKSIVQGDLQKQGKKD